MSVLNAPESSESTDEWDTDSIREPRIMGRMAIYDLEYLIEKAKTEKRHLACINFYCFIHYSRRKLQLSVKQLARKADVDYSELMSLERDTQFKLKPETVINLAKFLLVDPDALIKMARLDEPHFDPTWEDEVIQFPQNVGSTKELGFIEGAVVDGLKGFLLKQAREKLTDSVA